MIKFLKKIAPFLILVSFLILSALLPEILGEDAKALAESYLGDNYKYILIAFFLLLFLFAVYINPEMGLGLFSKTDKNNPERYNIPPTDENHELLRKAKAAIAASNPDQALELLSTLKLKNLDIEITALSARLADLERTQRFGTESYETETREHNKINKSIIFLITALEKEIAQSFEFYYKIRAALKSRYETRLSQKLSNRQPVNLRLVPSTAGTTPQAANTFVQYSEGQIRGKLAEYYQDAHGRLLLIGVPGAGKTTLLLQLELELLEKEITRIPVILNMARWNSTFPTLEDWIQDILPSEMGLSINKKMAGDLIAQNRLILLLDGLDEVKEEDRQVCLEAIGRYGEDSSRYFILSSRIDEYKAAAKDAPVNGQVEVGTLAYEQLIEQLEKVNQNEGAKRLLLALKEDEFLREIAEIPFYFNTLQLLFARGKYLHEFNFSATEVGGRKKEIEQIFVFEMFQRINDKKYNSGLANKYLGFFASRLKRLGQVDFELTHLQYSWCKLSSWGLIICYFWEGVVVCFFVCLFTCLAASLAVSLTFILFDGLEIHLILGQVIIVLVSPVIGLLVGLVGGLVYSFVGGLVRGRVGDLIGGLLRDRVGGLAGVLVSGLIGGIMLGLAGALVGGLVYSFVGGMERDRVGGRIGGRIGVLVGGLIGGIMSGMIGGLAGGLIGGIMSGMIGGLAGGLVGGLIGGLIGVLAKGSENVGYPTIKTIEIRKWRLNIFILSWRTNLVGVLVGVMVGVLVGGLIGGLIGGLVGGVIMSQFNQMEENHFYLIQIKKPFQRFTASANAMYFSILQHWHLRHLLHKKGLLPKKLVPFLNDMVKCNILETTGASWRFRHRILQDYFADQWVETEFEPEQK